MGADGSVHANGAGGTTVNLQLTDVTGKPILGTLGQIGITAKPGRLNIVN